MTVEKLLESAKALNKVSDKAVNSYEEKSGAMVQEVDKVLLAREDINEIVGRTNFDMMRDNHRNHAEFVISYLKLPDPEILVDTVLWVFRAYRSRGFHPNYWACQLNAWLEAMKSNLDQGVVKEISPLYSWFIVNIPAFSALSEDIADRNSSLH